MNPPTPPASTPPTSPAPLNFIEQIVEADNASGRWGVWTADDAPTPAAVGKPRVHTRFPPEPNGYLHVGHAKSICLNFGLARKYGGKFNLRFDDTNPAKEEQQYVDAIKADLKWLGADWEGPSGGGLFFASDYFEFMLTCAEELIAKGKAYVCDLSPEEVSARRGKPGVPATSPFRDRPAEESLRLIREMKEGKHPDGSRSVRARIDLASPNFNLRDPVMYRILHQSHHNTGARWCIYPMYDWAHGLEDSLEKITHSICTLEFEDHRPLYDWFINAINEGRAGDQKIWHAQQIEFAKGRPTYTVLSKRNLLKMVQDKVVSGWDDPRMPTISGMRRRGYTPESLWNAWAEIGVTKVESWIDVARLENALREHLNKVAPRYMAVLRPLKVIIDNFPEGHTEWLDCQNNPEDPAAGSRKVPFTRELLIERDDFMESPPKKFFRLTPPAPGHDAGNEVRFRWAYFLKCIGMEKDSAGNLTAIRCTYDPATKGGDSPDGRKVKGTIHWVSAAHAKPAEVRLFDRLFKVEEPGTARDGGTGNFMDDLNPDSLEVLTAMLEPALADAAAPAIAAGLTPRHPGADPSLRVQFERLGYFCLDRDSTPARQVWNRAVTLKDSWAKAT